MQIILDGKYRAEKSVVALGMFDGVHIGHQVLLRKARALADERHMPLIVCTFAQHPLALISPEKAPAMLTTPQERADQLQALGVDVLYAQSFDEAMMHMLPEEYVGQLVRRFHPSAVVCGYNHTFGRSGSGTPALLGILGGALGFDTIAVPQITLNGQEVSSTAVRSALKEGNARLAWQLLGRPYEQQAVAEAGDGGTCRLSLSSDGKQPLPAGIYRILWDDGQRRLPTVLHQQSPAKAWCQLSDPSTGPVRLHYLSQLAQNF